MATDGDIEKHLRLGAWAIRLFAVAVVQELWPFSLSWTAILILLAFPCQ
jgi:hypothetical protein